MESSPSPSSPCCGDCSSFFDCERAGQGGFYEFGHCSHMFALVVETGGDGKVRIVRLGTELLDENDPSILCFVMPRPKPEFRCQHHEPIGNLPRLTLRRQSCSECRHWTNKDQIHDESGTYWGECEQHTCGPGGGGHPTLAPRSPAGIAVAHIKTDVYPGERGFPVLCTPGRHMCASYEANPPLDEHTVDAADFPLPVTAHVPREA